MDVKTVKAMALEANAQSLVEKACEERIAAAVAKRLLCDMAKSWHRDIRHPSQPRAYRSPKRLYSGEPRCPSPLLPTAVCSATHARNAPKAMTDDIPERDEIDLTLIELIDWLREWGVSARQAREIVDERVDEAFRIHAAEYPLTTLH